MTDQIPLIGYADTIRTYDTAIESSLSEEEIVALEGKDEAEVEARQMAEAASRENQDCIVAEMEQENAQAGADAAAEAAEQPAAPDNTAVSSQPLVEIPREKLNDFDYLIQNFYQVDNTTTINSSQLNAEELLSMDLTIKTPADQPQILIYHTHSQEMFADSDPNDVMTGVMGTGEYLTSLLQEKYGLITLGDGSYIITAYPVKIVFEDILLIVLAVLSIGYTASYFPVKYLVNKLAK